MGSMPYLEKLHHTVPSSFAIHSFLESRYPWHECQRLMGVQPLLYLDYSACVASNQANSSTRDVICTSVGVYDLMCSI